MAIEILLLTQADCEFCEHAQQVLARLEDEYPLMMRTLDIGTEEGRSLAEQGGVTFAPGLFVAGRPFSYGRLSERRLRRHLEGLSIQPPAVGREEGSPRT